ncbi:hypothetical protein HYX14_00695 [Candidatus Woesearchaeota archaeon]|nr:hypothetical protein [Candidatus Woesearchaeota archaeon]
MPSRSMTGGRALATFDYVFPSRSIQVTSFVGCLTATTGGRVLATFDKVVIMTKTLKCRKLKG